MTTNYFDINYRSFYEASVTIERTCTEFVGRRSGLGAYAYRIFAECFSKCDDAIKSATFDCTVKEGCESFPAFACVDRDGGLALVRRENWDDWCFAKYGCTP